HSSCLAGPIPPGRPLPGDQLRAPGGSIADYGGFPTHGQYGAGAASSASPEGELLGTDDKKGQRTPIDLNGSPGALCLIRKTVPGEEMRAAAATGSSDLVVRTLYGHYSDGNHKRRA